MIHTNRDDAVVLHHKFTHWQQVESTFLIFVQTFPNQNRISERKVIKSKNGDILKSAISISNRQTVAAVYIYTLRLFETKFQYI